MRGVTFASGVVRDLRHAVRRLAAAPAYALFSIATLALAIGITTAVYSVVHHFLRVDYGIADRHSLSDIREHGWQRPLSRPDFRDIVNGQESFAQLAAWSRVITNLSADGTTQLAWGEVVSGNYFTVLRPRPMLGRMLTPADDAPMAPPAVVLAATTARAFFGDAERAVGQSMMLSGSPVTVVGVAGEEFKGVSGGGSALQVNFWVPLSMAPQLSDAIGGGIRDFDAADRSTRFLRTIGRLNPAIAPDRATTELGLIGRRLNAAHPLPAFENPSLEPRAWSVGPAFPDRNGPDRGVGRILIGLPLVVFLIACTNLANLSLSRGIARRNALAVRSALGATRARLVREEASEAVVIAAIGGAVGLAAASWMLDTIVGHVTTNTSLATVLYFSDVTLTPAIAATTFIVTVSGMVIAGLLPAWSLTRCGLRETMASGSDTTVPRWRGRSNLIAVQVGVSVGLFLIAFSASRVLPGLLLAPGPKLDGLAAASVPFGQQGYDAPRTRQIAEQVLADLRRMPEISMAGAIIGLEGHDGALLPTYRRTTVTRPDEPLSSTNQGTSVATVTGTPEMFSLLGVTAVSGRVFTDDDRAGGEPVIVISDSLANDLFGATMVAGQQLQVMTDVAGERNLESVSMRVVGVVPARSVDQQGAARREVYLPLSQHDSPSLMFLAKGVSGVPVEPLRQAIRSADPLLATAFIGDGVRLGAVQRVMLGTATTIGHGLAAFALLLALAGLYGVLSHLVSLRMRELAVRVALGATARRIAGMVLRDGLRPVVEGLLIALGAATLIRKILSVTVVEGLSSIDPVAFVVAAVLLLAGGLAACLLPARRAARIDPNVVLKEG